MNPKLLVSSNLVLALALASCGPPRPYQPDYMVNAAVVCDYDYRTPTLADDCDRVTGYYYHPGSYHLYWRPIGSPPVVIYDNYRIATTSYSPGASVRLNEPIATNASGQPVRDNKGQVRTAPKGSNYDKTPLSSTPKTPSSYKPTVAKPATGSTGSTGSIQSGSMNKKSGSSTKGSSGSSSRGTTVAPPVRSNSSSSFSKTSGSSKSSGSARGSSFGSSKSSGG